MMHDLILGAIFLLMLIGPAFVALRSSDKS